MNQQPLDLLSEDDRKELELLFSIIHSETLSTAAKLEEVARLLAKHGLLIPAPVTEQTWSATELATELNGMLQRIDAGYQHAVPVIMAMKSFETGRKALYNHSKREITLA